MGKRAGLLGLFDRIRFNEILRQVIGLLLVAVCAYFARPDIGTVSIGLAKIGLHRGLESGIEAILEYEALAQALVRTTGDTVEAMTAFLEKREPKFQGK